LPKQLTDGYHKPSQGHDEQMRRFPREFSEMLTPSGMSILACETKDRRALFARSRKYFVVLDGVVDTEMAEDSVRLLDTHLYPLLSVEQRRIAPDSISRMKENYQEELNKTMHIKTAFFRRRDARAYRAADRIGLLSMLYSDTFISFAEAVTGLKLDRNLSVQVSCYEHGDYVGPHNDHHPEEPDFKSGYLDFHVMFTNNAVAHQFLVYEERGHFSRIVDLNIQGGVSIYKLPFWHFTTPLTGKANQEADARRWLLLGSFRILTH